jgi:predicted nucleic acid-binding Zn ribbon protein
MPIYRVECESCGNDEGFDTLAARAEQGDQVRCMNCGELCTPLVSPVGLAGMEWAGGKYIAQVGRSFRSSREMEKWAAREGLVPVTRGDSAWRGLRDRAKEARNRDAQKRGYRDAEDLHRTTVDHGKDLLAENRQKKIDEYHNEHGSAGKQPVDTAFGALRTE